MTLKSYSLLESRAELALSGLRPGTRLVRRVAGRANGRRRPSATPVPAAYAARSRPPRRVRPEARYLSAILRLSYVCQRRLVPPYPSLSRVGPRQGPSGPDTFWGSARAFCHTSPWTHSPRIGVTFGLRGTATGPEPVEARAPIIAARTQLSIARDANGLLAVEAPGDWARATLGLHTGARMKGLAGLAPARAALLSSS